jgi:carbon storage regulator
MLVLTRRAGESIVIGDEVRVVVLDVRGDTVRLGIEAPRNVQVHRAEVYAEAQAANANATGSGSPGAGAGPTPPPATSPADLPAKVPAPPRPLPRRLDPSRGPRRPAPRPGPILFRLRRSTLRPNTRICPEVTEPSASPSALDGSLEPPDRPEVA